MPAGSESEQKQTLITQISDHHQQLLVDEHSAFFEIGKQKHFVAVWANPGQVFRMSDLSGSEKWLVAKPGLTEILVALANQYRGLSLVRIPTITLPRIESYVNKNVAKAAQKVDELLTGTLDPKIFYGDFYNRDDLLQDIIPAFALALKNITGGERLPFETTAVISGLATLPMLEANPISDELSELMPHDVVSKFGKLDGIATLRQPALKRARFAIWDGEQFESF